MALFKKELELCGLETDETFAVLTSRGVREEYVGPALAAAMEMGAEAFRVEVPTKPLVDTNAQGFPNILQSRSATVEALNQSDLLLDLVYLLWTKEQHAIQASGTRIITCIGTVDVLTRLFPSQELKSRVLEAGSLLEDAKELRFTNDGGTDVVYEIGQYSVLKQYGFVDEPGRWDNFPSALVAVIGNDERVDGEVVLQPGDIIFPFNRYASEPVRFKIEGGVVTDVKGGVDGVLIREYMRSFNDARAYAVSHIGWGLNEKAKWSALAMGTTGDARSVLGNVLFSTGPNLELGGSNDTPCHLDFPMRDCSLYLDGDKVIDHGNLL